MKTRASRKDRIHERDGQRAALFPALSEGSKEKRAVSILLACMEQVPELTKSLLQAQSAPLHLAPTDCFRRDMFQGCDWTRAHTVLGERDQAEGTEGVSEPEEVEPPLAQCLSSHVQASHEFMGAQP